jgi:elongation factor 1-alpha
MSNHFPHESEEGNVEYKLKVTVASTRRFEELATQLKFRLDEKGGEAFYVLGVSNEGEPIGLSEGEAAESLENLKKVAEEIGARATVLRQARAKKGQIIEVLIRRYRENFPISLAIVTLGHADHGKTTTVGVLVTGEQDDGDGTIMSKIARYKHEIQMRRTSSVSEKILGFDEDGNPVNPQLAFALDESEVFLKSSKIVSFVDVGGHEKYLKTAARGLLSHSPDYGMLVVASNAGVMYMTREHLGIALSFHIPFFAVLTKTDLVDDNMLQQRLGEVERMLKMPGVNKVPLVVRNLDDVVVAAKNMASGRIAPIFLVSNRTRNGLDLLTTFLNLLPPRLRWKERLVEPFLMYVDEKYDVPGIGTVVAGLVLGGSVDVNQAVRVGPMPNGTYRKTRIRSIQVRRGIFVERIGAGNGAAIALADVQYDELEKGMALVKEETAPVAIRRFLADVFILHHPTTIREGYECVFHINAARVTGRIEQMSKTPMRSGDKATITVSTLFRPFYAKPGQEFLLREGRTRGIGTIREILASP